MADVIESGLSEKSLTILTRLGSNIKFVRNSLLCLKLNDMAKVTGISRDVLCRLEVLSSGDGKAGNGRVYPSLSTIIKFCESMGIEVSELLDKDIAVDVDLQKKVLEKCSDFLYESKSVSSRDTLKIG